MRLHHERLLGMSVAVGCCKLLITQIRVILNELHYEVARQER